MSNRSISRKFRQTGNKNMDETDDWSHGWLEYLFNNKILLPDIVRSEKICIETNFL